MRNSSLSYRWDRFASSLGLSGTEMAGIAILRPSLMREYFTAGINPEQFERSLQVTYLFLDLIIVWNNSLDRL